MSDISGYKVLKDAIQTAQCDTGADLQFRESSTAVVGIVLKQLHVDYRSGNEYLRLDMLMKALGQAGSVKVFEFRGRGVDEQSRLVAEIDINATKYQLVYNLA